MTPIEIALSLAYLALAAGLYKTYQAVATVAKGLLEISSGMPPIDYAKLADKAAVILDLSYNIPRRDPTPATSTDHDLVALALREMSKVSQLALAPYPAGSPAPDTALQSPRQMPNLELIKDDDTDPLEAFLGPDFLRESSALWEGDFGVPGLEAMEDGREQG